jgi:hypothetical protein
MERKEQFMSHVQRTGFIDLSMVDLFIVSDQHEPHKRLPFLVLYNEFTRRVEGGSLSKQNDETADQSPSAVTYPGT